jgi:AmiR/NasT family two-component response regulator
MLHEQGLRGQLEELTSDMDAALASRAVIDQAKGIVMAAKRCSPDEAFHHLVELSSTTHTKLRDVARSLVEQASAG